MLVADVAREYAWVRTPAARVAFGCGERTINRTRSAVRADCYEGRAKRSAQVVFGHHEVDGARLAFVREDKIKERVQVILLLVGCDFRDAFALKVFEFRINDGANEHAASASAS